MPTRRVAGPDDLPAIEALERATFERPWSETMIADELARPFATLEVLEDGGRLVAWCCSWVLAGEAHVLRVGTDPAHRRRGLAGDLLRAVIARARSAGADRVLLEVGRRNAPARALYERAGFSTVATRAGYYADPPDDALVMELALGPGSRA